MIIEVVAEIRTSG